MSICTFRDVLSFMYGPRPFNSTGRHGHFLESTGDTRLSDMRQENKTDSDMRHAHFLNSTCDMEENKRQRHVTLPFLKMDMRHRDPPPLSRAPHVSFPMRDIPDHTMHLQGRKCLGFSLSPCVIRSTLTRCIFQS